MRKTTLGLLLILLFALPLVLPFFRAGYFPTHDGEWAVVRQGAMHRALMAGHFPVRWAANLNFGYGYPLFLFTYPLPYYLGEIFYLFGFGLVGSVKLLFVLSAILSAGAMFWLGKELFGRWGGLISAVFYLYTPYRLVNLYVRGSLGESLAFVFYPLLFLSVFKVVKKKERIWLAMASLFLAGLLLIHNVAALIFVPFLATWGLFLVCRLPVKKRSLIDLGIILVLGVGSSAFFLLPALLEKSSIVLSQKPLADVAAHFVLIKQLIFPGWGFGTPQSDDPFSFQLGWVHLLALVPGLYLVFRDDSKAVWFKFFLIALVVLVVMMLPISYWIWRWLPLFSEVDFSWRALGPAGFFLAISCGLMGQKKRLWPVGLLLVVLVVLANRGYALPSGRVDHGDDYYLTNEATTTSADELMPIWAKQKPTRRAEKKVEIVAGEGEVSHLFHDAKKITFSVEAESDSEVQINTIYFPGWLVAVDQQEAAVDYANDRGLVRLKVGSGQHQVAAEFGETPLRWLADAISVLCLGVILALGAREKLKKDGGKR